MWSIAKFIPITAKIYYFENASVGELVLISDINPLNSRCIIFIFNTAPISKLLYHIFM